MLLFGLSNYYCYVCTMKEDNYIKLSFSDSNKVWLCEVKKDKPTINENGDYVYHCVKIRELNENIIYGPGKNNYGREDDPWWLPHNVEKLKQQINEICKKKIDELQKGIKKD